MASAHSTLSSSDSPGVFARLRYLRPEEIYHLIYLAVTGLIVLACWSSVDHAPLRLGFRLGVAAFILSYVPFAQRRPTPLAAALRDFYYMLVFIYYYMETATLHQALWGGTRFDDEIAWVDQFFFGFQPSLEFWKAAPRAWFSELMNFCYTFYYMLFALGGLVIWLCRDEGRAYGRTHHAIVFTMLICYLIFIAFPVLGPQFRYADQHDRQQFAGYVFKFVLDSILEFGEVPTGAFPSSHVALAMVIMLAFWNHARMAFWVSLPWTLGLMVSTVYIQAHYVIDIPAGVVVGLLGYWVSERVRLAVARRLHLRHESSRPKSLDAPGINGSPGGKPKNEAHG